MFNQPCGKNFRVLEKKNLEDPDQPMADGDMGWFAASTHRTWNFHTMCIRVRRAFLSTQRCHGQLWQFWDTSDNVNVVRQASREREGRPDTLMAGHDFEWGMSQIELQNSYFHTRCFQGRRACFSNKNAMFGCVILTMCSFIMLWACYDEKSVVLVDGAIVPVHIVGRLCKWRWWLSFFRGWFFVHKLSLMSESSSHYDTVVTMTMNLLYIHIYIEWGNAYWLFMFRRWDGLFTMKYRFVVLIIDSTGWDIAHCSNCSKRGGMVCIILMRRGTKKTHLSSLTHGNVR